MFPAFMGFRDLAQDPPGEREDDGTRYQSAHRRKEYLFHRYQADRQWGQQAIINFASKAQVQHEQ